MAHSEETKRKIQESVRKHYQEKGYPVQTDRTVSCPTCSTPFKALRADHNFCSSECYTTRGHMSTTAKKESAVKAVTKRRKKLKEMAVEYKGGKCEHCGYSKCIAAFDFHHSDPTEKDFAVSQKGHTRSWERVKQELDKCILLCANCHREEHARLRCGSSVG